jgi:acetolactate synthase I/II/III large subunit
MIGAEALMRALAASGVEVCFTNPGTTEMHLVGALDAVPRIRAVLGLFEGVCTGAADGYGRMADRPALTLLHLGPGLANGLANLHNARRAWTPLVNLVGDHPTWHVANDPPLASDIEGLARTVSKWTQTTKTAQNLAFDGVEAVSAALSRPCGISTLVIPADCAWDPATEALPRMSVESAEPIAQSSVDAAAHALGHGARAVLLLGGAALRENGLKLAGRIAAATGCRLMADTFVARMERGAGRPRVDRLPYFPEQIGETLRETSHLIVAGTREPVAFFGYPSSSPRPVPESCEVVELGGPQHDLLPALEELAFRLAGKAVALGERVHRPELPSGPLTVASLGAAIAALQPPGTILVDEGATSSMGYWLQSAGVPPYTYLGLTGGAIGQGLPCATGAAIACPDRPVIAFQADGSALYTAQALWTQAREGLDVTTVICANREYRILRVELGRADIARPGPQAESVTSLRNPEIDWVELSRGLGVPAARAENADTLVSKLRRALAEPGPHLIEAIL